MKLRPALFRPPQVGSRARPIRLHVQLYSSKRWAMRRYWLSRKH